MTSDGPASYAASNDFRTGMVVDFFAKRQGVETRLVAAAEMCTERPDWLIVEIRSTPSKPLETAPDCDLVYERVEVAEAWGLSGITWALYRKREGMSRVQVLSALDALRLTPVMR